MIRNQTNKQSRKIQNAELELAQKAGKEFQKQLQQIQNETVPRTEFQSAVSAQAELIEELQRYNFHMLCSAKLND